MDWRLFTFVLCVLLPGVMNASCPVGQQYCFDRGGCVSSHQNCSNGDILRCMNTTAPCYYNGTMYCLDIWNYTCGNISCENDKQYCPRKKECIDAEEHCCSEKDEACVNVLKYKDFFSRSKTLNSICHIFAEDAGNFSARYPEYKYNDPLEKKMCDNGTYFCPLVLHCVSMNLSCNPDLVYQRDSEDVFAEECGQNETFCSLYMHCIPSDWDCSYRALFDWHDTGNMSVDPFSQSCPTNQSFCPMTFSCEDSCERNYSMGNSSFTNVTDSTRSGWLETCKYRKLIEDVFWEKESECKPRAEKCQKKNDCDFEICYYLNTTDWVWDELKSNGSTTVEINTCLFTVNASVMDDCNITRMSCGYERLCEILEEKMEHSNMSMNDSMWIKECNMTVNVSAKMHECNISKYRKNMSCGYEKLCEILDEKMEHLNMSMDDSMWIKECNMTVNVSAKMHECNTSKYRRNMSCGYEKLCDILEEKMEHSNMSMNDSMWIKECKMTVNVSAKMHECNTSKYRRNMSCGYEKLCDILEEKMEHSNMSMNDSMWIKECKMTVNVSAKMHECNTSKYRRNMSCGYEKLCDILEEKMEHSNMSLNDSMWIKECNITVNVSAKMHECNTSKYRRNMSCGYEKLCDILEEKMEHSNMSLNDSMWIKECNITVNVSAKMHECNMSKDRENKACNIHELCDELADYMEEYENGNMTNTTVKVEDCYIRISEEVYQVCKKNRSCEINSLCKDLKENNYNESKINTTIRIKGCDVKFNPTVIDACGITFHHCKIEDFCSKYRELAVNYTKKSFPKMVEGCKVDWNEMEQCNITFKNDSCEIYKLCHLLDDALERYKNGSAVNETVSVDNCNIMINQKVYYICGKHSCELSDLCKPLRKKLDMERDWSMNSTIEIEMCHVTLNFTVLEECNITMMKNDSKNCKVNKLCKAIRENNYNSSMVNKTIYIKDCKILFDKSVLDVCDITFKTSCKVEDLCSRYRELGRNHDVYSFPKYIGKCKVNMDDFEQCNVTLQELNKYRYHIFYNGFKISDSIKNVSFVAIRGADVGSQNGHWKYENDGAWIQFDSVSSDRALVLASTIRLRFLSDTPSWYGVATLMYTAVESGPTGSRANVSDILHDPRNTLALLQYPSRPMANVSGFTGGIYTVGEDEDDGGFMVDEKIKMSLSHTIMDKSMNENMTDYFEHLDSKLVEDFNETVKCFKRFQPAIAIVEVGKSSQGAWKVNNGKISSATIPKPKVVAPHDLLRFMSAKHVHGNWSMKFVAVAYSNCSRSVKKEYFDAPALLAHALKGVVMTQNTSKQIRNLLESALEEMASSGSSYSLMNVNGAVESLRGSTEQKNEVKDIFAEAFETVTLRNKERPQGLPRFLDAHGSLVILNNPTVYTFKVRVTPRNDQPEIKTPRIILPAIAYNLTTTPNSGKLVKYLLSEAMATDIDEDKLGIAIVEALSTSIGSWQYKAPSGAWTEVIVDNQAYSDGRSGNIPAFVLNSSYSLRFQMHNESILWSNLEASQKARIVFLPSDGSDGTTFGRRNISRPSEATSAYGKKSVTVIAQRLGCDGRAGSKGRIDLCGVCGGNGKSCEGCDGVLNSGAIYDECGNCTGGNTNASYNALKDCANECGLSFLDSCGICQRKGKFVNFTDCTGTCSGKAEINECGFCVGGTSGKDVTYGEDACGICGGDNSSCTDCDDVPNGGKSRDYCDNCLLPSDSRWNRACVKLKKVVPNSGPLSGGMKVLVLGAGLKTYSRVSCAFVNNATNSSHEISSSSFAENGGRVIQFNIPPVQVAGYYTIQCQFDSLVVTYSVEETFLVYNKSAITYTSISPDSININTAETVVIEGNGFVNASDIACVSLDGRVFEAEYESSTRVSCSIPATKASVRLSLGISFSRGDRRPAVNNLNFTIYANASIPTSARFLDSLRGIVISFDVPTKSKVRSSSCSEFFPSGNVSLFGSRSKCFFRTSVEMIILLRGRPAIVPNDTVIFKLASVTRQNQKVTKEPTEMYKNLVIGSPTVPTIPVTKLTGTSILGLCAKFRLNAAQYYGGGGRRLTFIYDVMWNDPADPITENATANLNKTRQYLKKLSKYTSRVKAEDNSLIVVGPAYKFTLKVKNFLGVESKPVSFVIRREDKTLPRLSLGSKERNMKAALGITLQGKVELSKCLPAGYEPKVLFTWEIQAVGINLDVTDKSRLYIPPGLLQGGETYTLTLTAAMQSDITLAATATVVITVQSSPLNAVIKGGESLVVGEDETIVLDASRSSDPDRTSETATYGWYCYDSEDNPCFEPDLSNPGRYRRIVIPSGVKATIDVAQQLKTNSNYKFVLVLKKGSRQKKASIDVIVKSGSPPMVQIFPPAVEKVNPTDVLIIESLIISKKTINATWMCVQSEEYGFVDLEDNSIALTPNFREFVKESGKNELFAAPSLVIAKNKLQDGVTYKFKLTAEHSDSSSFADVEITTNKAPSQGMLEVEPSSGFFGNTTFTLNAAEGWDDDADDLPLLYQFGYYIKDSDSGELREELLETPIYESSLDVDLLPQGDASDNHSLKVFVKVSDIYGAVTTQETTVVVKPKPLDASDVNQLAGAVDSDFESGDLAKGAAKANAIAAALSSSNQNDPNTTKAAREFKNGVTDKLLDSVEGGGVQDKSSKEVVKGSLLLMTIGCQPNCNPLRVLRNLALMFLSRISNKRSRRAVVVDYENIEVRTAAEVEGILKISQNVINPEDFTNNSLEAKASFLSTVQGQEPSLCKGLATGGPYELAKTNITVSKAIKDAFTSVDTEFMEVSTSTAPQYIEASVTYRLGQTLKTQYESWSCTADDTCTGTCIATAQFKDDLLIQYNPAEKNVTRLSDVASIRLYNPQTLAEISVSGLAIPVALRFPIKHVEMYENYTKDCRLWHEGSEEWQMSGCSLYSSNNSIVECRCTELGYVAVFLGEEKLPTTAAPTTQKPTTKNTVKQEEARVVEFAFVASYSQVISGNTTKSVFINHLRFFLAQLLNISQSRIKDIDIRSGSIIVTFTLLPSNDTNEASVNSTLSRFEQLVKTNNVNVTLPGSNQTLRVDPSSFKIIMTTPSPTLKPKSDDDDDGLSTAEIVIIAVVCAVVVIALIAAVVYYCTRVRPGKISPHSSHMQLNEQQNNNEYDKNGVDNAVDTDEKAV